MPHSPGNKVSRPVLRARVLRERSINTPIAGDCWLMLQMQYG